MKFTQRQLKESVRTHVSKALDSMLAESLDQDYLLRAIGHEGMQAVRQWVESGSTDMYDLPQDVMSTLYEYFLRNGMPYGVAKARDGDPGVWMADKLEEILGVYPMRAEAGVPRPQKRNPAFNKTFMDLPKPKPAKKKDPMKQRHMNLQNEDLGLAADIALGVMGGVTGLYALAYGVPATFRAFGNVVRNWQKDVDQRNYAKARAARDEEFQTQIEFIASKFEKDQQLAQMLAQLDEVPYSDRTRTKKDKAARKERNRLLKDINAHVKSKLNDRELGFVTDLNKFLRGGSFSRAKV